jgi:hypothetical protein
VQLGTANVRGVNGGVPIPNTPYHRLATDPESGLSRPFGQQAARTMSGRSNFRDDHGHDDGNEDHGDHGHDDGNEDYGDYGHDGNGDYGDHGGDELARTATVVMHDLLGDKTVPPEQASDYFDVVREFYSEIPDAIILKLGGDASTLDHCVFILPAADYDSTGHLRVSPHARAITELFQDGTAHSCSCSEYRLARKGTCVHTVFAQRLRDLTQRAYVSFSNIVRTVNATRRMYESIGAHTSVQDRHTAVRNALGAAMGISVAYAQRGLKASGLPTFTVYCVMDFLSPTIPLSVNVSIAKLEATDKLIDLFKTTSSLSASPSNNRTWSRPSSCACSQCFHQCGGLRAWRHCGPLCTGH